MNDPVMTNKGLTTVFFRPEGNPVWDAALDVTPDLPVFRLSQKIKAHWKLDELTTLTLHIAKDKAGKELGAALDGSNSLREELSTAELPADKKIRIVVKVAAGE